MPYFSRHDDQPIWVNALNVQYVAPASKTKEGALLTWVQLQNCHVLVKEQQAIVEREIQKEITIN